MTNRIKLLDPITANQIAAGEVVERPASVIKELVENSIDAGGTRIDIEVNRAGMELIRVTDNGWGMNREDAVMALQRHATSKIRTPSDLAAISSLGFRGEALPSIASVSRMELLTTERNSLSGTHLVVSGGIIDRVEDAGGPAGTTCTVRDLFYNTPARRKFLKSEGTELGQISDLINRVVMACPEISFRYISLGKILLQTSGTGNLLECISQVYGKEITREMIPVTAAKGEVRIEGYVGRPQSSRASRNWQSFFINGRYVKSSLLARAVAEGYHTMLPGNRHPVIVLKITVPVNTVDVNVHPTKLEVRFAQEAELTNFVTATVREALTQAVPIPGVYTGGLGILFKPPAAAPDHPDLSQAAVEDGTVDTLDAASKQLHFQLGTQPYSDSGTKDAPPTVQLRETNLNSFAQTEFAPAVSQTIGDEKNSELLAVQEEPDSKLPELLPLGQVDSTYIVARGQDGLYILDQHAAHERINYERIWARAAKSQAETQMLLEPLTIEFTNQEVQLLTENIVMLNDLGFLLEFFGGNTFLVRGKPQDLSEDPRNLLRDLLDQFVDGPAKVDPRKLREELIYLLACKASVKAHEVLSREEMEQLILLLGRTDNPFTCPHGRPTIIAITGEELAKRFQRV